MATSFFNTKEREDVSGHLSLFYTVSGIVWTLILLVAILFTSLKKNSSTGIWDNTALSNLGAFVLHIYIIVHLSIYNLRDVARCVLEYVLLSCILPCGLGIFFISNFNMLKTIYGRDKIRHIKRNVNLTLFVQVSPQNRMDSTQILTGFQS